MARIFLNPLAFALTTLLTLGGSVFWGLTASAGFLMGLAATLGTVLGTWGVIDLLNRPSPTTVQERMTILLRAMFFLAKLPLFAILAWASYEVGGNAPGGFASGLGLVYCWAVGWAQARQAYPPNC